MQDEGSDDAESSQHKKRAGEEKRQAMKESEEQLQQYTPRIPGTVLLVYRRVPCYTPSARCCCQHGSGHCLQAEFCTAYFLSMCSIEYLNDEQCILLMQACLLTLDTMHAHRSKLKPPLHGACPGTRTVA